MATKTASVSGLWSDTATWGGTVPVNGDAFNIPTGVVVKCDVDQSGMAAGMAVSVIDGLLHFDADTNTCLKMNGNLTGTGALYICERATVTGFSLTSGKINTYQVSRSLDVATVEDTLGAGYLDAVEELVETAIDVENAARVAQGLNEMMPDAVQDFIEATRAGLTLSQILTYVESTQGSFYHDTVNDVLYIHTSDSTDPSGKTIIVIEPINRPAAGSEYRSYILFNSTGTIAMTGTPIIRAYGWYPEREWAQLAADAAAGQNQIVLEHDMGFQEGDVFGLGSGEVDGILSETAKGIYTISSYNSQTKTATLTTNLQTNRIAGDVVAYISRPIKINRTSGTTRYISTVTIHNGAMKGVLIDAAGFLSNNPTTLENYMDNWLFDHCSCKISYFGQSIKNSTIKNSIHINSTLYSVISGGLNLLIERCINICGNNLGVARGVFNCCITQNTTYSPSGLPTTKPISGIFKNFSALSYNGTSCLSNSILSGADTLSLGYWSLMKFVNCIFEENATGYGFSICGVFYNCLFYGDNEIMGYDNEFRPPSIKIESFDHNQILGNYKAWMPGGKIETALDGSTILPGRLIFTCESADYPVFRDFPVLLPAYRTSTWQALTKKSFTGGSVKIELIDPANDPLIDPSSAPMASYSLPDQADTNLPLKLGYKSDKAMQAIIRISAQNASGIVEVDTRLIENRVQHGQ